MAIQSTSTLLSTSINVAKRTHAYPIATALAAVVSVGGYLMLIPRWGLFGAAASVVAGQVVFVLMLGYFAQRYFAIHYEWRRLWTAAGVAIALYGIMVIAAPAPIAAALGVGLALLAMYPVALVVLGFFKAQELQEIRQLLASLRDSVVVGKRVSSTPDESEK